MAESARSLRLVPKGSWAPRTKFVRPVVSVNAVIDDALLSGVRRSIAEFPITLISAQAGAGKTTLAAAAVGAGSSMAVGWITLDGADDDVSSFLALLGEAINTCLAGGCPAFLEFLAAGLDPAIDPRRAVGVLINDLLAADPPAFVIVIDDLHVLSDPASLSALDYLLANSPPAMHVLLTSRVDPPLSLSRLRTTGRLAEVRGDDLKLDARQADTLLNERLGLGMAGDEVAAIVDAVGGWATGVRLLGRSLHRGDVMNGPRPSAGDPAALYDYLTDEVLADESEDRRQFLFDTCVLTELTPRACAVLADRDDAAAVLSDLQRRLHFLVLTIDADAHLYRYHDLFAEFLRRRLAANDPARLAEQHGRAASVVSGAPQRIEHLVAAGDYEGAADAIEAVGRDILHQPTALHRVSTWIDWLPPEVVGRRLWLQLLAGVAATNRGDMTVATELLEPLIEPLRAADDFLGEWLALRNLHQATNDHRGLVPRISALAERLEFAQLQPGIQVDHHVGATYGAMYTARWDDAAAHVARAFELATSTDDPVAAEILALHVSPFFGIIDGGLDLIEAYIGHVDARTPQGPSFIRLGVLHQRALASLFRGEFTEAAKAATAGRGLLDRLGGGQAYLRTTFDWVMSTTWFASGELHRAEQQLAQRFRDQSIGDLDRAMNRLQAPMHARVLRAQRRPERIPAIVVDLRAGLRLAPTPEIGELMVLATNVQLAWGNNDLDAALADLRAAVELEDALRFVPGVGSPRVDLAVLLHDMGRDDESRQHLAIALRTCEVRGTPGLIAQAGAAVMPLVEDARKRGISSPTAAVALSALGSRPSPSRIAVPGSPEVLSPREVEVLRLLVAGASNQGIADALVVSEHTAKTHVRHIMSKLAVRSRAEAAARARLEHLV